MGRKRFVTSDISTDRKIAAVADENPTAALMWPWFCVGTDDWGRMTADPLEVKLTLFQAFTFTKADITAAMELYDRVGLVHLYQVDGNPYLQMNPIAFYKYQSYIQQSRKEIDNSKIPPPHDHVWGRYWSPRSKADKGKGTETREAATVADKLQKATTIADDLQESATVADNCTSPSLSPTPSLTPTPSLRRQEEEAAASRADRSTPSGRGKVVTELAALLRDQVSGKITLQAADEFFARYGEPRVRYASARTAEERAKRRQKGEEALGSPIRYFRQIADKTTEAEAIVCLQEISAPAEDTGLDEETRMRLVSGLEYWEREAEQKKLSEDEAREFVAERRRQLLQECGYQEVGPDKFVKIQVHGLTA